MLLLFLKGPTEAAGRIFRKIQKFQIKNDWDRHHLIIIDIILTRIVLVRRVRTFQ